MTTKRLTGFKQSVIVLFMITLLFAVWGCGKSEDKGKASATQTEEAKDSGAPAGPEGAGGPPPEKKDRHLENYKVIQIHMLMEAGSGFYEEHPGGMRTIHSGIGRIDPLGLGSYVAGIGYPESKEYPYPDYFTESWLEEFDSTLFCIYRMKDGDIYAWDGIAGNIEPEVDGNSVKSDYLINVIVGGTGAYEGATGMLLGRTVGGGEATEVAPDLTLPKTIIKDMEGYIKIPKKKK